MALFHHFLLLTAAMNPCMCGFANDPQHVCQCSAQQLQRYRARVSGPLLDRIDIHVEVPPVRYADLTDDTPAEPSSSIRQRVNAARERQQFRFAGTSVPHNAAMSVRDIRQYCQLDAAGERLLEQAMQHFGLSARAYDRIRKVACTIANLDGAETITSTHLSEAIQYRTLDRRQ
jgi:magnesium chelatase family protein